MKSPVATPRSGRDLRSALAWSRTPWTMAGIFLVIGLVLPWLIPNDYIISLIILILIYALLNQSWNLTIGMCGIWNFGQLAIFAIGGYVQCIVTLRTGLSPWPTLVISGLVAAVAALVLILPALRLRGIYAALLTFAFAEVFRLLVISDESGLTGGSFGIGGAPGLFDWLSLDAAQRAYLWLMVALCVVAALLIFRIMQSPFGIALTTLRDSTRYSIGMGVNRRAHVLLAQALSGFLAGLAGALYAAYYSSISPVVMGLTPMGILVLMIVIGGMGTVLGPIVGTFVVMVLTEVLRDTGEFRLVALGAVLLVILAFKPAGVTGLASDIFHSVKRWTEEGDGDGGGPPGGALRGGSEEGEAMANSSALGDEKQAART